ncbi:MAG: helix-turn-helix transcriptional regulator [Bacteroidales bacterium]|nr:helix-turn-helix transcriptional regulator [Bacteroidales bacterium]
MEYTLDIYSNKHEVLMQKMAKYCKSRRLERGYSRRTLAERTGIPAPTIERFEKTGKISFESFCILVVEFDYLQEMEQILSKAKYTTGSELETINRNKNRIKGR